MEIHSTGKNDSSGSAMEAKRFFPRRQKNLKIDCDRSAYQHNLQLYSFPPIDVISLSEFETLAIERLKVLKAVERAGQMYQKNSKEYFSYLSAELRKLNFKIAGKFTSIDNASDDDFEERRRDHISHFILRLAFCRLDEQRRWFLQQEVELFKFRFGLEGPKSIARFLSLNGLNYDVVDGKSLSGDEVQFVADASGSSPSAVSSLEIFKVPFTEALELVRCRKVFLKAGFAYIFRSDLVGTVSGRFRASLSLSLSSASKHFGLIQEQDRLVPVLNRLNSKAYLGKDYGKLDSSDSKVTPDMLDSLAESSFPLCMRQLHADLRRNHHLKHGGRMQYGLFLKGIGLSLEDAMSFWRSEFTKLMESDKFDKQYAYNIRHNYGKEGKRADYTPYSCRKIINSSIGPQDNHGCPFKETDPAVLRQRLEALRLKSEQQEKIIGFVQSKQFDRACSRFFEYTHSLPENSLNQLIGHPNQYFEESRKFRTGEKTAAEAVLTQSSHLFENTSAATKSVEEEDAELMASVTI